MTTANSPLAKGDQGGCKRLSDKKEDWPSPEKADSELGVIVLLFEIDGGLVT